MEDVKAVVVDKKTETILIDSREERRYLGLEEPIDKKAGHIPGAINKPWFEGLSEGFYKPAEVQKERFKDIDPKNRLLFIVVQGLPQPQIFWH